MQSNRQIAKVAVKVKLGEKKTDATYWRAQPIAARLAALEEIRREYHGWKEGEEPQMEKVVKIVRLKK